MPINAGPEYQKAEEAYARARSLAEKLAALERMLRAAPKHKGSEKLLKSIKEKIAKLKARAERERGARKSGSSAFSVRKEGAAQIVLVGATNTGKSTLLKALTGAPVEVAAYEFTTKKPEVGILDYHGVKLQVVEIPAIVDGFALTKNGPTLLSIIRHADVVVYLFRNGEEKALLDRELGEFDGEKVLYTGKENFVDVVWEKTGLIKVFTKQPGKKKDYPPIALKKGATVRDVVGYVHKDFVQRFKFARVFGTSAKFDGQRVGLQHVLHDNDVVEFHLT